MNDYVQVAHQCGHCGYIHSGPCPRVKAIEYNSDGSIKRVEYHENYFARYPSIPPSHHS